MAKFGGSFCHDLFANNLTNTATSIMSEAIADDQESCQDNRATDTDNTDWEDSNEEEKSKSGVDETMSFQRHQLKINPPPKRESLLTLALQSTQHHGPKPPSEYLVPESAYTDVQGVRSLSSSTTVSRAEADGTPVRIGQKGPGGASVHSLHDVVGSPAQSTSLTRYVPDEAAVLSPGTTRHNMVVTELTESLCRQLLRERKANAVLKRRHTLEDVTSLTQCTQQSHVTQNNRDVAACSWDQGIASSWEAFSGYHTRGW